MATSLFFQHAVFGLLLAIAASSDVATRRVPNVLVVLLAATGVAHAWSHQGLLAVPGGVLASGVVGVPLMLAWMRGLLGGGDVKLAAAAAIWVGIDGIGSYVAYVAMCGGVLSLAVALRARCASAALRRVAYVVGGVPMSLEASAGRSVPYAAAIAAGALHAFVNGAAR